MAGQSVVSVSILFSYAIVTSKTRTEITKHMESFCYQSSSQVQTHSQDGVETLLSLRSKALLLGRSSSINGGQNFFT